MTGTTYTFLITVANLAPVVDPIGSSAVFAVISQHASRRTTALTAICASITAISILSAICVVGPSMIAKLGLGLATLRLTSGMILFAVAWRMFKAPSCRACTRLNKPAAQILSILTLLLAGPACIAATLTICADAQVAEPDISPIIAGILAVEIAALVCMLMISLIIQKFDDRLMIVATRAAAVMLFIIAARNLVSGLGVLA